MQISIAPLIYVMIFVAVVVLVEGLYLTVFGKSISLNSRISRLRVMTLSTANRTVSGPAQIREIFAFIENPRKMVPGTKMSFAGIPDPQKRADLIAWLKANGGS